MYPVLSDEFINFWCRSKLPHLFVTDNALYATEQRLDGRYDALEGTMSDKVNTTNVLKGAAAGIVGGLVASFVMNEFQTLLTKMSEQMKSDKGKGQDQKNEDEPATVKAAKAISENVFDHKLAENEKEPAGEGVHYAMGAASGLIYGIAAELTPAATVAGGIPFGAAVWMIADEIAVPALGLSKPSTEFPLSTHAYALSSHLVFGLTTEAIRRGLLRVM
jgi:putative membrane protein